MEQFAWPQITVASGGWVLLGWVLWLLIRKLVSGDLVTRREADAIMDATLILREKNDRLLEINATLTEQNHVATKALAAMNDDRAALRRIAELKAPE